MPNYLEGCVPADAGGDGVAGAGENAILTAASLGDREAFEVVVHRYGPALHRLRAARGHHFRATATLRTRLGRWL
ncbi:hypothetical protein TUM20983_16660 [Mycobacterium antarcticum]|uniref:hypothetical protein n=1 Tax=unclassified Mycolicibacterium TaxID=2636767 RepID=UPI0023987FAC|nr:MULTISPECIES: hypothetical protein [unclassified Mycolicibacterium]GLP74556.1 hypothetical protein TUM20983_16660 [Mycolicibacterium sp. TUM20983]GLP80351.1 hypothetical protein TUM20984_17710 [Mycolicibacterium sp. TUM20984]